MGTVVERDVPIALLYQQAALHAHLKQALTELGARVVYDAPAETFDHGALTASGARVVVVNLDPQVEEEFEHLDALLEDEALNVIFNDAEVSSRLEGWDQARWARHLASKILGVDEIHPPRPVGASAVPVKVKPHVADPTRVEAFELRGTELAEALAADTGEAIARTRSELVTGEEPVAAELIPRRSADAPTLELPVGSLVDAIPAGGQAPAPAVVTPEAEIATETPVTGVAAEFDAVLRDFGFLDAPAPAAVDEGAIEVDAAASDASLRDFNEGGFDALTIESVPVSEAPEGDETLAFDASEFAEFERALAAPDAPSEAPVGLDEVLFQLSLEDEDAPAAKTAAPSQPAAAKPAVPSQPAAAKAAPAAPAAPTPENERSGPAPGRAASDAPTREFKFDLSNLSLALDDDEAAPAAPAPTPTAAPAASAPPARSFDLSGLSLAPLDGEVQAPTTGRATFRIDEPVAAPAPAPAVVAPPAASAPVADDPFADLSLDALEFKLDEGDLPRAVARVDDEPLGDEAAADALMAELAAFSTRPAQPEVPADGKLRRVWVLGASIGGPEAVREFLAEFDANAPVLFLLAQHMGADFLDLMLAQLGKATKLEVRQAADGDELGYGQVVVVPLSQRLLVDRSGRARIVALDEQTPYSPSIDRVLIDVADRFGADAGAIIFSGMAHDAIEGATYLHGKGGRVWVQDPASCVIASMVDGAKDAGVVSFEGPPVALARQLKLELFRAGDAGTRKPA